MTDEQQPNEDFKKDELRKTQAKTIEDQAKELVKLKENVEILMEAREEKKTKLKNVSNKKPIPDHLSPVQDQHLDDLLGIRMKCSGNPGGDCLSSCTTIHLSNTNDSSERKKVNRRINHHIADHFDHFYKDKIALPYSETVGVGREARQVTCSTREELLNFLRSEDSLCAYSNSQELLAICNMLNIKIHIFTYCIGGNEKSWSWKTVCRDPEMASYSDFAPGTVPDMLLYNSDNCHYNLLVEDHSRLAVLGLVSMGEEKLEQKELEEFQSQVEASREVETEAGDRIEEPWTTVGGSRRRPGTVPQNNKEVEGSRSQESGDHLAIPPAKEQGKDAWNICNFRANSNTQLSSHMNIHNNNDHQNTCTICQEDVGTRVILEMHIKNKYSRQWNCNDCDFQTSHTAP